MTDDLDEFERNTARVTQEAIDRHRKMPYLVALSLLIVVGVLSMLASIQTARGQQQASKADIERSQQLIEQVRQLQAANADRSIDRYRSLCAQINAIAEQLHVPADDCDVSQ